jgi:hypothetical protein
MLMMRSPARRLAVHYDVDAKHQSSADAGHRCDFNEQSPGVLRLAINGDVDAGSPGVSLAGNVEVNVAIDVEVVYTGNNEVDQMKREQFVMRRSNLQGVHEDYGGIFISSEMRCTRFEACGEDVNTTEHQ